MSSIFKLIDKEVFESLEKERKEILSSCEKITAKEARTELGNTRKSYELIGDTANIDIKGELYKSDNFIYDFFGIEYSSYNSIQSQIERAEKDPAVKSIQLNIDSPGGTIDGFFRTADTIKNAKKNVVAVIEDMCASAGYGLASQANNIVAMNKHATIGSIGVICHTYSVKGVEEKIGIESFVFRGKQSPYKNIGIDDEGGKAFIQQEVDLLGADFYSIIAEGRGQEIDFVLDNYGKGATFNAEKALKNKMIDEVKGPKNTNPKGKKINQTEEKNMDFDMNELVAKITNDVTANVTNVISEQLKAITEETTKAQIQMQEQKTAEAIRQEKVTALKNTYKEYESDIEQMAKAGDSIDAIELFALKAQNSAIAEKEKQETVQSDSEEGLQDAQATPTTKQDKIAEALAQATRNMVI